MLWLLKRTDNVDWDESRAYVVRAETEEIARQLAYDIALNEGQSESLIDDSMFWVRENPQVWIDNATCTKIEIDGPNEIILCDYKAG